MGIIKRAADLVYTFRFLKLLVTSFDKTAAFKLGIIDEKGKRLKKPKTPEEIQAEKESLIDQIKKLTVDRNRFDKDSDVSFPFRKTREDISNS